jgi:hypothetical protein
MINDYCAAGRHYECSSWARDALARERALEADERSRKAFREWQAEREPAAREAARLRYEAAEVECRAAWEIVGPDPILQQVSKALKTAAARGSDPNPDDPDDPDDD